MHDKQFFFQAPPTYAPPLKKTLRSTAIKTAVFPGSRGELTLIGGTASDQLLAPSMRLTHPHLALLPQRPATCPPPSQHTHTRTQTHTQRHTYFYLSNRSISILSILTLPSRNNVNSGAPNRRMQMNSGSNLPKQSQRHHHVKSSIQHVRV